nr:MAG TPA: hypothetical protein [Caudoviricetes sp.]
MQKHKEKRRGEPGAFLYAGTLSIYSASAFISIAFLFTINRM